MRFAFLLLALVPVFAVGDDRDNQVSYAAHLAGCGVQRPSEDFRFENNEGVITIKWRHAPCPAVDLANLPSIASANSFVATSDVFRAEGVATDTNTIREVRQDLKALKLSLTNIVININTNPAFNNAQGKILKEMVNAMAADIKANLKLLRDGQ